MTEHLTDSEITAGIVGETNDIQKRHLDTCLSCRAEIEETRTALECLRQSVHSISSARCSHLQHKAHLAEYARRSGTEKESLIFKPWRVVQTATAAVLLILSGLALTFGPRLPRQTSGEATHAARGAQGAKGSEFSDDALLIEVQTRVQEQIPQALEPAGLIAEERDRFVRTQMGTQAQQGNSPESNQVAKEGARND